MFQKYNEKFAFQLAVISVSIVAFQVTIFNVFSVYKQNVNAQSLKH